jgi:hypothetical protein
MKCINCGIDNDRKERVKNNSKCKNCNHDFVFEPTEMPDKSRLTDTLFAKLIVDISAKDTLSFTPRQLYYLLERRLRSRADKTRVGLNIVAGIVFVIIWSNILLKNIEKLTFDRSLPVLFIISAWIIWQLAQGSIADRYTKKSQQNRVVVIQLTAIIIIVISLALSVSNSTIEGIISSIVLGTSAASIYLNKQRQQSKVFDVFQVEYSQFQAWLDKWIKINKKPKKILIESQFFHTFTAPKPEVTAYSFDRVVICDKPEIAQLLISNNFHFENNCAILSIDGYPQSIFTTTMEMLRRNLELKVYALHDCSPTGIQLVSHLRQDDNWFPHLATPIIDVGILPRQIIDNIDLLTLQSDASAELARQLPADIRGSLNPKELEWLDAGCYLELEFFSPQKLIRILQRAISENRELATIEGDGMLVMDNSNFYIVDSFG